MSQENMNEVATFGGGCFWCTEAIYEQLEGVISVTSGYSGGETKNPSYEDVCSGETGHAEVIQISFDPSKITYLELLEIFFKTHNPTTLNQQGADKGTQYRSIVFYHNEHQKKTTNNIIAALNNEGVWQDPITTTVEPFGIFYNAEKYHQNYYQNNSRKNQYCELVITPKIEKFEKLFKDKIKNN